MSKNFVKIALFALCVSGMTSLNSQDASARAGGGRSFGMRGSRSYSTPMRPSSPFQQQARPQQPNMPTQPYSQPMGGGGGFLRNMAGGLAGGFLGSMLFRSLGFGGDMGTGLGGGGGSGWMGILLMAALGFFAFKMFSGRRREVSPRETTAEDLMARTQPQNQSASFDQERFKETAQDIFFKVQGAWTRGDLGLVRNAVSPDTLGILQQDLDQLKKRREVNRLENISVRGVDLTEVWNESGVDYATVCFRANLLDYNTDETGKIVSGSDAEPVKFEEFWTFQRPTASSSWILSAVQQA
mgnify:FL=1